MSDDRLKRALGTIGDAAGPPSPWETVVETTSSPRDADVRRFPARRALALAASVAVVVGAGVVLFDGPDRRIAPSGETSAPTTPTTSDPSSTSTAPAPIASSGGWRQVDDLPSGRYSPLVVSIEGVIHVIGGQTTVCPSWVSCLRPSPDLSDGHRLVGDRWEAIAPAPRPLNITSPSVVVRGELVALSDPADDTPNAETLTRRVPDASPSLVVYDPSADEWRTIEVPMAATRDSVRLVAAGDDVVVVPIGDDDGLPTMRYGSDGGGWTTVPADPLVPSTDRRMVAVGESLYLFGATSDGVSTQVSAAVLEGSSWRRLDGVPVGTTGPWAVIGSTIVNSLPGCAERLMSNDAPRTAGCTPSGGILDTSTGDWSALPQPLDDETLRWNVLDDGDMTLAAAVDLAAGFAYDPTTAQWFEWDNLQNAFGDGTSSWPTAAGRHVVMAGGYVSTVCETDDDPSPVNCPTAFELLSEVWIWTPPAIAAETDPGEAVSAGWELLPDSPLSPRYGSIVERIDDVIYVIGGDTDMCPPGADCGLDPSYESLRDGAALDLATGEWRSVAEAPVSLRGASSVVLSGAVIAGVTDWTAAEPTQQLWRYSPGDDRWDRLQADPTGGVGALVAVGDDLAVIPGSDERVVLPDRLLDLATGVWSDLPDDPLGPSFDRTMVAAGDSLYLFAKDLVASPGAGSTPSVARVARFDLASQTWTVLPDSEILTTGPWLVAGDLLVNPSLGCADGGGNSYGRCYPMGGIFDTATNAWRDLPPIDGLGDEPYGDDAVAITTGAALSAVSYVLDRGFWVLDVDALDSGAAVWSQVTRPDDVPPRPVIAVGPDLLLPPAAVWPDGESGRLLGDIWIWRAP